MRRAPPHRYASVAFHALCFVRASNSLSGCRDLRSLAALYGCCAGRQLVPGPGSAAVQACNEAVNLKARQIVWKPATAQNPCGWRSARLNPFGLQTMVLHLPGGCGTVTCDRSVLCCSSSVVEHSLGKGEAESSILSCSTIFSLEKSGLGQTIQKNAAKARHGCVPISPTRLLPAARFPK